jgi:hypothetical protein
MHFRKFRRPAFPFAAIGRPYKEAFMRSRRLATSFGFVLASLILLVNLATAQSDIQCVGKWKLNVAKSKLGPGPSPRSITSTIETVGDSTRMTGVRVDADGSRTEAKFTAKMDGKDYPIKGSANADTVSLKRIDARTIERTDKRAGKVIETSTTVFSTDGKTSTTTGKGHCSKGEEFDYVAVNEKQ